MRMSYLFGATLRTAPGRTEAEGHQLLVRAGFVGAFTATDLWAAVAEARAPGSTPEPELGRLE